MDTITDFFKINPQYFGIIIAMVGIVFLLASIYDWNWLFRNDVSGVNYNLQKIDGWLNLFGRNTARVFTGIMASLSILAGIVWFWIYVFYY